MLLSTTTAFTTTTTFLLAAIALWPAGGWTAAQCTFKDQGGAGRFLCKKDCLSETKNDDVFGTDIYHEDSNVCRAALHAGFLHLEGGNVNFRLSSSNSSVTDYTGTVRNRIMSVSGSKSGRLYRFIGRKPETSSDPGGWTMLVHDSYNSDGILHVSCLSSGTVSFVSWKHTPMKEDITENNGIKQLIKKRIDNGHAFVCQGKDPLDDSEAVVTFRDAWYLSPKPSFTASVGENLTVPLKKVRSDLPDRVFLRRLPDGWKYSTGESSADAPLDLVFPSLTTAHAGIYILGNSKTDNPWSRRSQQDTEYLGVYFQLIVRDCADQRWGPSCSQWCPDCRNGGQCHPLTGRCICAPGFFGPDCSQACPPDTFGFRCEQECSPYFRGEKPSPGEDDTCKGLTVCLPYPYGCSCVAGYKGLQCDEACPDGHYGSGCTLTCSYCVDEKCESSSGRCLKGCVDEVACDNNLPLSLPHLTEPPRVEVSSSSSVSVYFNIGRSQRQAGATPVKGYVVQFMMQNQDIWDSVSVTEEEFRKNKSIKVPNLVPGYQYRLRVLMETEKGTDIGRTHSRIFAEPFELPCREHKQPKMTVRETTETTAIIQLNSSDWENFRKCNTVMEAWLDEETKMEESEAPFLELTDLEADTRYDAMIRVSNVNGEYEAQVSFLTLPKAPEPVTGLRLYAGINNITVNFSEPYENITDYILEYRTMDTDLCPGELHPSIRFKTQPYMITQVDAFRAYNVCVAGTYKGSQGNKTCSTVITKTGPPIVAPELMKCEPNFTEITCRTNLTGICGDLGGEKVQVELLTRGRRACDGEGWNVSTLMTRGDRWTFTGTIGNLSSYVGYAVRARVINEAGVGPPTQRAQILKTLPAVPSKPVLGNVITASSTSLLLLWDDPCPPNGEILRHQIIYKDVRASKVNVADLREDNECKDSKYQHCYHLDELETGLTYAVQVVSFNKQGRSLPSEVKQGSTKERRSDAPRLTVDRGATSLTMTFFRPRQTNGRLTKCRVQLLDGNKTCEITPEFMSSPLGTCNVTDLKSGEQYDVSAQCYNSAGWGMTLNMTFSTLPSQPRLSGRVVLLPDSVTKTSFVIRLPAVHRIGQGQSTLSVVTVKMDEDEEYSGKKNFTSIYFQLRQSNENGPKVRRESPGPGTCHVPPYERIVGYFEEPFIPSEYTVGEGNVHKGYVNCELITGQRYLVGVVACTILEGRLSCTDTQLNQYVLVVETSTANTLAIVICVVLVVIVFTIFVGVFCMLRKRKSYSGTSTFKKEEDNVAVDLHE